MAAAQEQEERNAERDYMGKLIEVAANYPIWDTVNSPTARIGTLSTKTDFTYKNSFIDLIESRGIFRPPIC